MISRSKMVLKFSVSFFIILFIISGCSSKPSLELESAKVELRNDGERLGAVGITSGEREGEFIVPIALSYDFVIINTGKRKLGAMEKPTKDLAYEDGIQIKIEPHKKLKEVTEEVMGFNLYDKSDKGQLGSGETTAYILKADAKGIYNLDLILGALEENPDLKLAPSMEQLEKLEEHAMDATLVVFIGDDEIARFDISDLY